MTKWICTSVTHWNLPKSVATEWSIFLWMGSNNAFIICSAGINKVQLKPIVRPWGFRRRMDGWHSTVRLVSRDMILSVIHQRVIDVPSKPENKSRRGAPTQEGNIHLISDERQKAQYQEVWEVIFHRLFTLGLDMTRCVCVCTCERKNFIFFPLSYSNLLGWSGNLIHRPSSFP